MSFVDVDKLKVTERLPGWRGRYFHAVKMTVAHDEFPRGASIHEHHAFLERVYSADPDAPRRCGMRAQVVSLVALLTAATAAPGFAQLSPSAKWATEAAAQYSVNANITYRTASNQALKMDVYYRRVLSAPQPTLVYMHGGFWVAGAKETAITGLLPWLEMGWNVVNVEYRLGVASDPSTLAPAAVDDCFCALRFVAALPANYNIDAKRIVVTGESAGGP